MRTNFVVLGVVLLAGAAFSTASIARGEQVQSGDLALEQTPVGPVSSDQAIEIATRLGRAWGEPNPELVDVREQSRSDYSLQAAARGEQVLVAGTGNLWIVHLSGQFGPNRVPRGFNVVCDAIYVTIDVATGDVISDGCQ